MGDDDLLFTDLEGSMVGLDEVIADGLERDYAGRHDALRTLLEEGSPLQRLHACVMLASWGVRDGFLTILDWAGSPDKVPWAGEPVSFDRMFGVDDAYAQMSRALDTARYVELTPGGVRLRVAATRALLRLYHRAFFDRWLQLLLDVDDNLAAAVRPQLQWAVERAVAASRAPQRFDMSTQAALLLRQYLAPRATATTTSAPNLVWPAWADRTSGAADLYVELRGPVAGARIAQPHHGQYVDLFVTDCFPVDVEAVVGRLQRTVKVHYDDPDISVAHLTVEGQPVRVLVETRRGRETMVVTVHFPPGPDLR